jgi:uncharacterized protein (DUF2249 family)
MPMRIDSNTKISKILKAKPEAIDIIADINTNFRKLQNPILRRSLAARVSVSDAARIGKVDVNTFLKALENIGFKVDFYQENNADTQKKNSNIPPDFSNKEIVTLDVRPIIAEGKDPFGHINKVAKKIKPQQVLLIINDFEPIPLVEFLVSKNFIHWLTQDDEGNYLTYFKLNCKKANFFQRLLGKKDIPCQFHSVSKDDEKEVKTEKRVKEVGESNPQKFDEIQEKYKGKLSEIDVRDLEMPLPMQNILLGIEKLNDGEALFVHHKRIPQFLLPELKKRNWQYVAKEINPDYTYLIVYKTA